MNMQGLYGNAVLHRILQIQTTGKGRTTALPSGQAYVPYATGPCVDISGYTGWGRMRLMAWAHTGFGFNTLGTGTLTLTPWHATFALIRGGTTKSTGATGLFSKGYTSALSVYNTPNGTATAFTAVSKTSTTISPSYQERWFDADSSYRWIGAGVTIAGTGGPKFAFSAEIEMIAKTRPTVDAQNG